MPLRDGVIHGKARPKLLWSIWRGQVERKGGSRLYSSEGV